MGKLKSWQIAKFKDITGEKGDLRFQLIPRKPPDTPKQRLAEDMVRRLRDADADLDALFNTMADILETARVHEKQIDEEARQRLYVAFDEQESANVGSNLL